MLGVIIRINNEAILPTLVSFTGIRRNTVSWSAFFYHYTENYCETTRQVRQWPGLPGQHLYLCQDCSVLLSTADVNNLLRAQQLHVTRGLSVCNEAKGNKAAAPSTQTCMSKNSTASLIFRCGPWAQGKFNNCGEKGPTWPWVLHCCFSPRILKRLDWLKQSSPEQEGICWLFCTNSTCTCCLFGRHGECSLDTPIFSFMLHFPLLRDDCKYLFLKPYLDLFHIEQLWHVGDTCARHMGSWIPMCI